MNKEIKLEIHFQFFDDECLPEDDKWVAWIEGKKGSVVSGKSIPDCMKELAMSLEVMELYEQSKSK